MARVRLHTAAAIAVLASATACTVHKTETPSLTGPSELSTSITVTVSPDVLTQDGASQSLVTITARDSNGQPLRNLSLRVEIAVENVITDFGTLSARNVVTDSSGHASLVYTAPKAVAGLTSTTTINILVTPSGSDFANATPRSVSIELVPAGTIVLPSSPLKPSFTVPSPNVSDTVVFTATVVDASGANATAQVASFQWDFGDGGSASGLTATHTFTKLGTFPVTLTITDALGRVAFITQAVTVGQGQIPTATFVTSPSPPDVVVGQSLDFNASGSTAAPGHVITVFAWNFGDGTLDSSSGALVTHSYTTVGTYSVTLKVTDDAGRKSSLFIMTVTVSVPNPTARISVLPPTGTTSTTISFVGNQSTAAPGHRIVSYTWNFGDGGTAVGATVTHRYAVTGTYTVSLIVTDEAGNQGIATASVTITP
ncbi:MAG TPA: PKD domain-containing protein [Vicinamibacterales bacterium]|nr:PKD domain-containing protein [Vicinamibacterales bacterium]